MKYDIYINASIDYPFSASFIQGELAKVETHLVSGLYNEKKDKHLKRTKESKLDERMDFSDAKRVNRKFWFIT
jgi:hypothetical protein